MANGLPIRAIGTDNRSREVPKNRSFPAQNRQAPSGRPEPTSPERECTYWVAPATLTFTWVGSIFGRFGNDASQPARLGLGTITTPLVITDVHRVEIFASAPGISEEQIEARVQHRMQRQAILTRKNFPMIFSLIDEMALRRPRGGPEVMREQLMHLYEMAHHPAVRIQIVPFETQAPAFDPAFVIAEHHAVPFAGYVESIPDGRMTNDRGVIGALVSRYDAIRVEAYPQTLSAKTIKEVLERWT